MQEQMGELSELCRFWIEKGLSVDFLRKLINCGPTDEIIGYSYYCTFNILPDWFFEMILKMSKNTKI